MIKLEDVTKTYKDVIVVDNVSITIPEGSFTGIVGESGSGKSTLLYLIGGLLSPNGGNIYISDLNIVGLKDNSLSDIRCNNIGFIFQFYNLVSGISVQQNVEMPLLLSGRNVKENERLVSSLLEDVGMLEYASRDINELSGGQQQRVAIARAMVNDPKVILADEPTGNLDSANSQKIIELLYKMNNLHKKTIVMVTHSQNTLKYCNNIIKLSDGKIVYDT
jgi:putative ABC transport system ATP-binding protein